MNSTMHLGAAVLILGIIYFMIRSPGFRVTMIVGAVVLGLIVFVAMQPKHETATNAPRPVIQATQLALAGVVLKPEFTGPAGLRLGQPSPSHVYWMLDGIVTNNAQAALEDLYFQITVTDDARTIAQESVDLCPTYVNHPVPPGETRLFHSCAIHFTGMPPAQNPVVTAKIVRINYRPTDAPPFEVLTAG